MFVFLMFTAEFQRMSVPAKRLRDEEDLQDLPETMEI